MDMEKLKLDGNKFKAGYLAGQAKIKRRRNIHCSDPAGSDLRLNAILDKWGVLTIQIGNKTLAHADSERTGYMVKEGREQEWARDVMNHLENEREDGSSILTDALDAACKLAYENGSVAANYSQNKKDNHE